MNILTFDIEEWFHILDNDSTKSEAQWLNYESRIYKNMERIFGILDKNNVSASFFVMGWIAEKYPDIVKQINDRGYEIGSHTHMHQLVYEQSPEEFKNDVQRSILTLENITGKKVKIFRAPGFSITENNKWALEILHSLGIEIDASIFPANRSHGGMPSYNSAGPSIIHYNGIRLKEMPINFVKKFSKELIFSGGGYFRLFPYKFIRSSTIDSDYVMSYFHPRDFDNKQPIIKELDLSRKFKSYIGIKGAEKKLNKWLHEFDFIDIQTSDQLINWDSVPIVKL